MFAHSTAVEVAIRFLIQETEFLILHVLLQILAAITSGSILAIYPY
jgi:hypothetical protein